MKIKWLHIIFLLATVSIYSAPPATVLAADQTYWEAYQSSGHKNPKWDSFVEAGFSSFDSGNLGSAEMFLQRAITKGCDDGLVWTKIGLFYEAQKNYKKAIEYLKKAAKRLPSQYPSSKLNSAVNEALGRCLYLAGDIEGAIPYLEKAASSSENFTALYFLGQIARTKKDYQGAIALFMRALKTQHPDGLPRSIDILIMTEIGKAYYEMKDFNASLDTWNRILSVDPGNQVAISYKQNIERVKMKEEEKRVIQEIVK